MSVEKSGEWQLIGVGVEEKKGMSLTYDDMVKTKTNIEIETRIDSTFILEEGRSSFWNNTKNH